ncbi:coiled-coil alpha-helical rod protein 1 [Clonorchis sinensis]|uniref:Coiled-coil alpha-helical rod protein 1 n=1 Tax=Clonorchis sinensis TaxID=79923 RepID=G7YE67_CLOSI|nr:coiled-coil alpha-helical rod protein 1 [Clonorchis sinensis]
MENRDLSRIDTNELLPPSAFSLSEASHNGTDNPIHGIVHPPTDGSFVGFQQLSDSRCGLNLAPGDLLLRLQVAEERVNELELVLRNTRNETLQMQRLRDEAVTELQRMRSYIGSLDSSGNQGDVTPEKEALIATINKLKTESSKLEDRNTTLQQQLDLSLVRVESLEAVLRLQEKTLCHNISNQTGKGSADEAKCDQLLRMWRTQTIRLLMQMEEYKADREHALARAARKEAQLEKMRLSAQTDQETMHLKLQASEAAFALETKQTQTLAAKLEQESSRYRNLEAEHKILQRKCTASLTALRAQSERLLHSVQSWFPTKPHLTSQAADNPFLSRILQRIRQLECRLNFASNRLPLLRTHMAHRRVISPGRSDQGTQTGPSDKDLLSGVSQLESNELLKFAQNEARQCRAERDAALSKLEQSAKCFHQRVQAAQDEVKTELCTLRESVRMLEVSLQEKTEELSRCKSDFSELRSSYAALQKSGEAERRELQTKINESEDQLTKAKAELHKAKRCLDLELDRRKTRIPAPGCAYEASSRIPGSSIKSTLSVRPRQTSSNETSLNMNQMGSLVQSLKELTQLADCLRSSSSSESEPDNGSGS